MPLLKLFERVQLPLPTCLVRDVHMLKDFVGPSIAEAFVHWTLACSKELLCVLNQFFSLCV